MIYKKLDFEEKQKRVKLLILVLLLFFILRIFFDGGEQQLEYYLYSICKDKYLIVQAEVCDKEDISWCIGRLKLISTVKENVRYEVDGVIYTNTIYSYPEYNIKDIVC